MNRPFHHHRLPRAAALAAAVGAITASAVAQSPDVIYLTGTVRDFLKSHPDFDITAGDGHVANNVELEAANNRPAFTGTGFEVASQWQNKDADNIAPHLFFNGNVVLLGSEPDLASGVTIDSWDSTEGTYGEGEIGDAPPMHWPAMMPEVEAPTGLPPHPSNTSVADNLTLAPPGSVHAFASSFQVNNLTVDRDITINIPAGSEITIYVTGNVDFGRDSEILVPLDSTLHIYHGGNFVIGQDSEINMLDPLNPDRCWIYNAGTGSIVFNQAGKVCAHIISPDGAVEFKQTDEFFGTIAADSLSMDQGSALHWDGIVDEICDEELADVPGLPGSAGTGWVDSASTFQQWFTDVLGVNMSAAHTIALAQNASGIYEYLDNAFFPIDDWLFGNEGDDHNYNFTFAFSANFVYEECAAHFFEFSGADDVWVYINGELALDLGGVMPLTPQVIEMDRLDLTDGEMYTLHFYYAQRNPYMSVFNVRTNVPFESNQPISASAPYD